MSWIQTGVAPRLLDFERDDIWAALQPMLEEAVTERYKTVVKKDEDGYEYEDSEVDGYDVRKPSPWAIQDAMERVGEIMEKARRRATLDIGSSKSL